MRFTYEFEKDSEIYDVMLTLFSDSELLSAYGFRFEYSDKDYEDSKECMIIENPCLEEVWIEMLQNGKEFRFVDTENVEDTVILNKTVLFDNINNIPFQIMENLVSGDYDGIDADLALQYILFNDEIFC